MNVHRARLADNPKVGEACAHELLHMTAERRAAGANTGEELEATGEEEEEGEEEGDDGEAGDIVDQEVVARTTAVAPL